jgi:hypothetical protein
MAWAAIAVGVVSTAATLYTSHKNRKAAENAADETNTLQAAEAAKLEVQKEEYKKMKFENPYENMENVYEDLTVNQQQAQFQAQRGSQQRANIMQNLRGAAGSSGIAGLAQTLANQGQLQTQRISASIGAQEAQNQKLAAQGAASVQSLERGGAQWVQEKEMDRQATLLGMQMGASAGANLGAQNAALNQQQVDAAAATANTQAIGNLAGTVAGADYSGGSASAKMANNTTGSYAGGTIEQASANAIANQGLAFENAPNTQINTGPQKVWDEELGMFVWR